MFTSERHKQVIDEQEKILESKKDISETLIKSLDLRAVIFGNEKEQAKQRLKFVALAIKSTDKILTDTSKLGATFAQEKIDDKKSI